MEGGMKPLSPASHLPATSSHRPTWAEGVMRTEGPLRATALKGSGSRARPALRISRSGMHTRRVMEEAPTPSSPTSRLPVTSTYRPTWAGRVGIPALPLWVTVPAGSGSWDRRTLMTSRSKTHTRTTMAAGMVRTSSSRGLAAAIRCTHRPQTSPRT